MRRLAPLMLATAALLLAESAAAAELRIDYINVGQGGCTLITGPAGTTILYDFGGVPGDQDLVPYLTDTLAMSPARGVDYTMVSHNDKDHYYGFKAFVEAGFQVHSRNYSSGSSKRSTTIESHWLAPAKKTAAGAVTAIAVGLRIPLGDGAEALVVGANGKILGNDDPVAIKDENDKSIALFVRYHNFQYLIDGDLGSGPEACTGHDTGQRAIEPLIAEALLREGLISAENGVDVLHIAHHGSESSTSAAYYNAMRPEVGLISVGQNQGTFLHPRQDVVDLVLLGEQRAQCVTAPPLLMLFQTEDGLEDCSDTGCTSFSGRSIGDISLSTDGLTGYTVTGNNRVHHEFDAHTMQSVELSWQFPLDENPEGIDLLDTELDSTELESSMLEDPEPCCKRCRRDVSQACGDACISLEATCSQEPGCACDG